MSITHTRRNRSTIRTSNAAFERLESRQLFSVAMAANLLHHEAVSPAAVKVVHATPSAGGTGISAEYFADAALTNPVMTRTDTGISYKGAAGSAAAVKSAGGVVWTGSIAVTASSAYTFTVQGAGGVKLTVNGVQLINTPSIIGGAVRASTTVTMVAGSKYDFAMQYTKAPGAAANVKLLWSPQLGKQVVVPQTALFPSATPPELSATTSGLIGSYYVGADFKQLAMTRVDPAINFNFGTKSPDYTMPSHTPFSIEWNGQFTPAVSQNYTFNTTADDGIRVYVGNQLVIDNFVLQSSHKATGTIALTAGVAYDLKVDYFNSVGTANVKLQYSIAGAKPAFLPIGGTITSTPPASGGVLTAVAAAADDVELSWTGSPNATGYTVAQSNDAGVTWVNIGTTGAGATTYSDTGLTPNTSYQFKVTPFGSTDTSTASNVAIVTTLTLPPGSVTATATSSTNLNLTWADTDGETGFAILQSINGGSYLPIATTPAGVTQYQVSGLLPGNAYSYEVESLNSTGNPSEPSDPSSSSATPTAAPAGLVATSTSTSTATLAWTDVVGEGGFNVERSTDDLNWTVVGTTPANTTTFTDSGLAPGTTYSYRIRGLSAADTSVASDPSAVSSTPTVTAAPNGVNATAFSSTLVNVTWNDVTGEAGFNVFESVDGGTTYLPAGHTRTGVTHFSVTPLLPATAYQFAVQAVNSAGQLSALSNAGTASRTSTLTLAPTALVALGTSTTTAQLTWTPAVGATGYLIERSTDGVNWTSIATPGATDVAYVDTTLSAGISYSYRIRATDAGGASDPSAVSVALTVPAAVTAALSGVNVATSSVSFPTVPGATSYAVQRSSDGLTGWTTVTVVSPPATPAGVVANTTTTPVTLSSVVPNIAPSTVYYYRVIASNATGSATPSAVVSQMTAPLAQYAKDNVLFGAASNATGPSPMYSVDMTAGTTTLIGQLLPGAFGANRNKVSGLIYYAVGSGNSPTFYSWDPTTGNNAAVGALTFLAPLTRAANDLAGNAWYTDSANHLYKLDPSGTTVTNVGTMSLNAVPLTSSAGNMTFSPTGSLILSNGGTLYTVNTSTAALTPFAALGLGNVSICYGASGLLYSTDSNGHIYSVNGVTATVIPSPTVPVLNTMTAAPEFVDLSVTATGTPTIFRTGQTAAYAVNVSNSGLSATNVGTMTVTVTLGNGLTYGSVTGVGWTAFTSTSALGALTVTMTYAGSLTSNGNAPTATLNVNVTSSAVLTVASTFTVSNDQFDTGLTNNTAVVTNTVA